MGMRNDALGRDAGRQTAASPQGLERSTGPDPPTMGFVICERLRRGLPFLVPGPDVWRASSMKARGAPSNQGRGEPGLA